MGDKWQEKNPHRVVQKKNWTELNFDTKQCDVIQQGWPIKYVQEDKIVAIDDKLMTNIITFQSCKILSPVLF